MSKELKAGLIPLSAKERAFLTRHYIDQNLSPVELSERLNVSVRLIYSRLRAHGISKTHPVTGVRNRFAKTVKYCESCGQSLPTKKR
jgi:hypothetical protein